MLCCKPIDSPIEPRGMKNSGDRDLVDIGRYQRLVGRLIYLSHTGPDITFAISVVSQYMHTPRQKHLDIVYRILRYLKKNPGRGLFFRKKEDRKVKIYTDANWAGRHPSIVLRFGETW